MAILSTMRDCAGCNPLLVPYFAENNLDHVLFGDAPVPQLEQAARLRPYHPIMVPVLCVMCIQDNITPWCKPPLVAVCRCRRCNKPCCYWHSAAHDFQRLPTGAYGCYGNPTDNNRYCSRANISRPNGCFEIVYLPDGPDRFAPRYPGPYGWRQIPVCHPDLRWHPAYQDADERDISEETRTRIDIYYRVSPEQRRLGPPPFVSVPVVRHWNDPAWMESIANLWQDMPPSYVNGRFITNLRDWHGRVFADGHHPTW